jgi:glycosyltransferase involved in cell wall biosynthesis
MDYVRYLFGRPHPELAHFETLSTEFKKARVIRLGYLPDEELVKIYNLATVYVQPSLYEGFGLPVLEALACGCPVVTSRIQALVEIAQGAVRFVNPKSPEEIARGIKNPLQSPRLPRVYSWAKAARETKEVYAKI